MNHAKSEFLTLLNSRTDLSDPTDIFEYIRILEILEFMYITVSKATPLEKISNLFTVYLTPLSVDKAV